MKNAAKNEIVRQEAPVRMMSGVGMQGRLPLVLAAVQEEFFSVVMSLGTNVFAAMLEDERTRLCGTRYAHDSDATRYVQDTPMTNSRWAGSV